MGRAGRVSKFVALPREQRRLIAQATAVVVFVRAALYVVPFRVLRRWAGGDGAGARPGGGQEASRVAWAVAKVSRSVPRATCLTQALATQWLLRRRGLLSTLQIGVGRDPRSGAFRAHAWVEHAGRVVIGDHGELDEYAPLPVL
jgi:hypothetical protein